MLDVLPEIDSIPGHDFLPEIDSMLGHDVLPEIDSMLGHYVLAGGLAVVLNASWLDEPVSRWQVVILGRAVPKLQFFRLTQK